RCRVKRVLDMTFPVGKERPAGGRSSGLDAWRAPVVDGNPALRAACAAERGGATLPVRMKLPGHCVSGNVPVTVSAYKSGGYEFDRGALCAASRKVAQQAAQRLANSCAEDGQTKKGELALPVR